MDCPESTPNRQLHEYDEVRTYAKLVHRTEDYASRVLSRVCVRAKNPPRWEEVHLNTCCVCFWSHEGVVIRFAIHKWPFCRPTHSSGSHALPFRQPHLQALRLPTQSPSSLCWRILNHVISFCIRAIPWATDAPCVRTFGGNCESFVSATAPCDRGLWYVSLK
jgi:hypothetical protein